MRRIRSELWNMLRARLTSLLFAIQPLSTSSVSSSACVGAFALTSVQAGAAGMTPMFGPNSVSGSLPGAVAGASIAASSAPSSSGAVVICTAARAVLLSVRATVGATWRLRVRLQGE
jgi:hypothetical protein